MVQPCLNAAAFVSSGLFEAAPKLESLRVSGNQLSGPLPELPTGRGAALRLLSVAHNRLNGTVPASWRRLGVFNALPSAGVQPSSAAPELPDYNELNLADNPFSGLLPNLTESMPEEVVPRLRWAPSATPHLNMQGTMVHSPASYLLT